MTERFSDRHGHRGADADADADADITFREDAPENLRYAIPYRLSGAAL